MNFDRSKAMRNAERFVAQGKIRLAIDEYKQVVEHDSRDFGTLNMLGDLYVKESNKNEAVRCYTTVAEHYSKQGFAQKAIAIYNKIARLKPDSPEVSEKLAELYKAKGSFSEAKSHYTTLAEHYMSKGYRMEALAIWKQIAILDPNNTAVFINLAEAYLQESEMDEAAEAYAEAATRFARAGDHQAALDSLTKALAINPTNLSCLNGYVKELGIVGRSDEAAAKLDDILKTNPHTRDVARLLIDCHIESQRPEAAEQVLIKLMEHEPANYGKFVDLAKIYIDRIDAAGASRALSMCSEHLIMGGQSDELIAMLSQIDEIDQKDLTSIRLFARYYSWKRDKDGLRTALEKMALVAREVHSIDDERYALSQLTLIVPHQTAFSDRLDALNREHGFNENPFDATILREQFGEADVSEFEMTGEVAPVEGDVPAAETVPIANGKRGRKSKKAKSAAAAEVDALDAEIAIETVDFVEEEILAPTYETDLDKELASISFYVDNGYSELAERTLGELRERYGDRTEFAEIELRLRTAAERSNGAHPLDIAEIRNEFGIDEIEVVDDNDFETHYQMAIAYQEMGLLEDAIKEYQDAINLVAADDGTRRFFQCANLLGHCFMQSGMAQLALTWYKRALETRGLSDEEKQGLWYELAGAFEANGDTANAERYYEQVYAENVDFRDVGERIRNLTLQAA
jgi:tetratricopeptide (TPR) repeat protein